MGSAFQGLQEPVIGGDNRHLGILGESQEEGVVDDHAGLESVLGGARHQVLGDVEGYGIQGELFAGGTHLTRRQVVAPVLLPESLEELRLQGARSEQLDLTGLRAAGEAYRFLVQVPLHRPEEVSSMNVRGGALSSSGCT